MYRGDKSFWKHYWVSYGNMYAFASDVVCSLVIYRGGKSISQWQNIHPGQLIHTLACRSSQTYFCSMKRWLQQLRNLHASSTCGWRILSMKKQLISLAHIWSSMLTGFFRKREQKQTDLKFPTSIVSQ